MCEITLDRSLAGHFSVLDDPRCPLNRRHRLIDMIVIAIAATLCGADGWVAIAEFGRTKQAWFAQFLAVPHGIPAHEHVRPGVRVAGVDANRNAPTCAKENGPTQCAVDDWWGALLKGATSGRRGPVKKADRDRWAAASVDQGEAGGSSGAVGARKDGPVRRRVMQWCCRRSSRASTRGLLRNRSYH